ncbi:hypothetical protein MTO96_008745 [Rhipicephalus appendiculatus]
MLQACGRTRSRSIAGLWIAFGYGFGFRSVIGGSGRRLGHRGVAANAFPALKVLDLGRHWRRSVQQHQSPAPAQAVLIKPSPFDPVVRGG